MTTPQTPLNRVIEEALGVTPKRIQPLTGGCIGQVYRVLLPADHGLTLAADTDTDSEINTVVVKVDASDSARLSIEGYMLEYLGRHSHLPVPRVFFSSDPLLVMSWLPGESRFSAPAQAHAAELLAVLHQITPPQDGNDGDYKPQYGLERDTLIGGLHQPNKQHIIWLDFFREERILHMAREGHREGLVPMTYVNRLEKFCGMMDRWLEEPEKPALLHGDAWTTNILAQQDRITGWLDPAIYYGHPEIELAFTTLFGTFGEPFFKRYQEILPISDGFFELRRDLYNLYPLLVHVRLFGGGYLADVDKTLKRIGC